MRPTARAQRRRSRLRRGLAGLHEHGALALVLVHGGLRVVADPQAPGQDLHASVVHLLPAVEAPALAHGADAARAHVVHVVEEHLVPAVPAAQEEGHGRVHPGPRAVGVRGQELVPPMRVVEVRNENPSRGEPPTGPARHGEEERIAIRQRFAHAPRAQQPHGSPEEGGPSHVLDAGGQPLRVEGLVALAARARVREAAPPKEGEEHARVAGPDEVPERDQRHRQPAVPLEGPLLEDVQPARRVPAELPVVQQVEGGVVVPVVLHDDVHPRQVDEVCQGVRDVVLPLVRREGRAVDHVVQDVHVLDAQHDHEEDVDRRAHAPAQGREPQQGPVHHDVQHLQHEDQRVDVPHVHLLLRADLREHERQLRRHGVGDVRGGDGPLGLLAPLVLVHVVRQRAPALARGRRRLRGLLRGVLRVEVARVGSRLQELRELVPLLVLPGQLLQVLVRTIKDGQLRVPPRGPLRGRGEQGLARRHRGAPANYLRWAPNAGGVVLPDLIGHLSRSAS
mmetsp:Transcript_94200/g.288187  ORF Transcript_94200/g.288187 Transcript_94200/m.288187 type:complete len:507 (+) Transcript_94200:309-1829(+)